MAVKQKEETYIGLDIGSTKVACVVGLKTEGSRRPSIIGLGTSPVSGTRKGMVINVEETVTAITAAVDEAERISGVAIDHATIGVDGAHIESINSKGTVAVGRADQEITPADLVRAEEAASAVHLAPNREILQVFTGDWRLDEQKNIADPVGMKGVRLEVGAHIITGSTPAIKSLNRSVYQAGIDIDRQILVPLAAAEAVLDKSQRELGSVLIDIGGGTTGLAVFEEGRLIYSNILPIGSGHITNDIAIGLKTSISVAEQIKLKYLKLSSKPPALNDKISIGELESQDQLVPARDLHRIAQARLDEIFHMVRQELSAIERDKLLPGGAVLTGGGANLDGIEVFAKQALGLPVSIGRPEGFSGIADRIASPEYAAPVGLMLADTSRTYSAGPKLSNQKLNIDRFKDIFKNFLP